MDRQPPSALSDEIDLYLRTYYSLLRSTGRVKVRAFEEAHAYSNSSLHAGAREVTPDVAAFAYSAARLPLCMPHVKHLVLGQSDKQFERAGFDVGRWAQVATRGRRRPLRWSGDGVLAVFVSSTTDIDDLVPMVTAYQIEWNKMHAALERSCGGGAAPPANDTAALAGALGLVDADVETLRSAFGEGFERGLAEVAARRCSLFVTLLDGTFLDYQRAAHRWWHGIEPVYSGLRRDAPDSGRPVYFVSSNTHSLGNLLARYSFAHREELGEFVRRRDPEGLAADYERLRVGGDEALLANLSYYLLHRYLHEEHDLVAERVAAVQRFDAERGIVTVDHPGHLEVSAQVIELAKLRPDELDPRVRLDGLEALAESDAVIVNIDYPLGMAAYHHLTAMAHDVGDILGIYVMGKAATLNGRVGDIMISNVAYDEHSRNTYLFRNCFSAGDVQPFVRSSTVFDNQKALTVRGSYLQNREYMSVFYREGYTVLEMEAGPYLSAAYELVRPSRHPVDEIVHLSNEMPFDFGLLHYASDTPYSRRQSLLSKSLSYFGVESTYSCAIAIVRRILRRELGRLAARG